MCISVGEDDVSFKRHMRVLQVEFKKTNRNQAVIEDLMSRTFPFRRNAIMKECLWILFEWFSFLQEGDQVGLFMKSYY